MATSRANAPAVVADRGRIIGLWQSGMTPADVADTMGVSKKTVQRWITRWEQEGSLATRPRSGRPRVTTPDEDARLMAAVDNTPMKTMVDLTRELNLPCHPQTTRNRLHKSGIHCYVPARKPKLTDAHKEARLAFALEYLAVDPTFWRNVIFTDEKTFTSVKAGARYCWRPVKTRYKDKNMDETEESGRVTVNMWGWMWAHGPGELVVLEGRFTSDVYIQILNDVLLPTVRAMAIPEPEPIILVHDNSSVHTSNNVKVWLQQHPIIQPIQWPAKSSDLNPIEHLWATMTRNWDVGEERSRQVVARHANEVWERLRRRPNICFNLVDSMPRRIDEVIDEHGGWTSY